MVEHLFHSGCHNRPRTLMGRFLDSSDSYYKAGHTIRILVVMGFGLRMIKLWWNSVLLHSRSYFRITGSTMGFTSLSGGNLLDGLPQACSFGVGRKFLILVFRFRWSGVSREECGHSSNKNFTSPPSNKNSGHIKNKKNSGHTLNKHSHPPIPLTKTAATRLKKQRQAIEKQYPFK